MVELVYSNASKERVGILRAFQLDMEFGKGTASNDFKLTVPFDFDLEIGSFIWIDNTEYGGIIDGMGVDYSVNPAEKYYTGRTWHGILSHKIIMPGDDHFSVSGDLNECIRKTLDHIGADGIFDTPDTKSGIEVQYDFDRFTDSYSGLVKMCSKFGAYLSINRVRGKVILSAVSSKPDVVTSGDSVGFRAALNTRPVNHLVCAGEGQEEERIVVHLYADENGKISQEQTLFGLDEVAETYNYSSADEERLIESGTERLEEYQNSTEIDLDADYANRAIGEPVIVFDPLTNLYTLSEMESVNVIVNQYGISVSNRLGDAYVMKG